MSELEIYLQPIANIGFPIVFCLLIYFDLRKKIDTLTERLTAILEKLK